jgi:adenine/guanine phosphoribosyltransferase-like PRPP-binding protein
VFEINLGIYNEMLRYEKDMDKLRALALWITDYDAQRIIPGLLNPREYVFTLIKHYSEKFAEDILAYGRINAGTIDLFHSSLFSINRLLGITDEDIERASVLQRYRNSGFWEMRRVIGQFGDVAEEVVRDGIDQIITAAVSGCVIGEYLSKVIAKKHENQIEVDHMVFSRRGIDPLKGYLSESFKLLGDHLLLVDDAVMETKTAQVMLNTIEEIAPNCAISILAVDIDPDTRRSGFLDRFVKVYSFEE